MPETWTFDSDLLSSTVTINTDNRLIEYISGFGALSPIIESQPRYQRGGSYITHARNRSREMEIGLIISASTLAESIVEGDNLLNLFKSLTYGSQAPNMGTLTRTREDGNIFKIDCFANGGLEDLPQNLIGTSLLFRRAPLRLSAPDPNFYSDTNLTSGTPVAGEATGDILPSIMPLNSGFGSEYSTLTASCVNTGTADSWKTTITVNGPVLNPIIVSDYKDETGRFKYIRFNRELVVGESLIITMNGGDFNLAKTENGENWSFYREGGAAFPLPGNRTTKIRLVYDQRYSAVTPNISVVWTPEFLGC